MLIIESVNHDCLFWPKLVKIFTSF